MNELIEREPEETSEASDEDRVMWRVLIISTMAIVIIFAVLIALVLLSQNVNFFYPHIMNDI